MRRKLRFKIITQKTINSRGPYGILSPMQRDCKGESNRCQEAAQTSRSKMWHFKDRLEGHFGKPHSAFQRLFMIVIFYLFIIFFFCDWISKIRVSFQRLIFLPSNIIRVRSFAYFRVWFFPLFLLGMCVVVSDRVFMCVYLRVYGWSDGCGCLWRDRYCTRLWFYFIQLILFVYLYLWTDTNTL